MFSAVSLLLTIPKRVKSALKEARRAEWRSERGDASGQCIHRLTRGRLFLLSLFLDGVSSAFVVLQGKAE